MITGPNEDSQSVNTERDRLLQVEGQEVLGLTQYERLAFLALAKFGLATAPAVSRIVRIPKSKVYDIFQRIEAKGLVEQVRESSPRLYRAKEIGGVLERLICQREEELAVAKEQAERLKSAIAQLHASMQGRARLGLSGGLRGATRAYHCKRCNNRERFREYGRFKRFYNGERYVEHRQRVVKVVCEPCGSREVTRKRCI